MAAKSGKWEDFSRKHPDALRVILFFLFSNGVTVFQILLMPLFKQLFAMTDLAEVNVQIGRIGPLLEHGTYYIFNYAAGAIADGGGGGLAYFLAVQITLTIAQIINFFLQRNITFKSDSGILKAAIWYLLAYVLITIGASALQGIYKMPVYNFFMSGFPSAGETIADFITMAINSAISFWVFYPIMKVIFKQK